MLNSLGIIYREESIEDVRFFKILNIFKNSPIEKAQIKEGEYLIGINNFKYKDLDELIYWCT